MEEGISDEDWEALDDLQMHMWGKDGDYLVDSREAVVRSCKIFSCFCQVVCSLCGSIVLVLVEDPEKIALRLCRLPCRVD